MCHLLLLLPILALPVFWMWPLSVSLPVYSVTSAIFTAIHVLAVKAMRRPVLTGREHMVGAKGRVIETADGHVTVTINTELWAATSDRELGVDEVAVEITDRSQPVGRGIGPAFEARDVLSVLGNERGAAVDLRERATRLAGRLPEISGVAGTGVGQIKAAELLDDCSAWKK